MKKKLERTPETVCSFRKGFKQPYPANYIKLKDVLLDLQLILVIKF